jgi:MarR-like DNA-binding transcriptional regulator SgrR of sgrS sRNA
MAAGARTRPHYGGTLHAEIEGDPWQRPGGMARRLVLDGLTRSANDGTVRPALAIRWAMENDSHRWQFWLRPGVHFSDGAPLTSTAVVESLTASCGAACPWTTVHALGTSVVFANDNPMPDLPALLSSDEYLIALSNGSGTVVGTGPFEAAGFANGVLTLAANDTCWKGRPYLDAIELRVHRSVHDQWLDLSVGQADLVEVPSELLRQAQQQRLLLSVSPPVSLLALEINTDGALSNPSLRAAIALTVDRNALFNVIFQKQGEVTASLLPASLSGYSFLFPAERDLKKAHELRGGLNPRQLTLSSEGGTVMDLAAQRIALNLREAGLDVQMNNTGKRADMTLRRYVLEVKDPWTALDRLVGTHSQAAAAHDSSPASLYKVEHEFLGHNTLIPLLYLPRAFASSSRVRDLHLAVDGSPDLADASLENAP